MKTNSVLDSDIKSMDMPNSESLADIRGAITRLMIKAENERAEINPGSTVDRQYDIFLKMAGDLIFGGVSGERIGV